MSAETDTQWRLEHRRPTLYKLAQRRHAGALIAFVDYWTPFYPSCSGWWNDDSPNVAIVRFKTGRRWALPTLISDYLKLVSGVHDGRGPGYGWRLANNG